MLYRASLLLGLSCSFVFAQNTLDTSILSSDRQKSIELNIEQTMEDSDKLKNDWINPITYKYIQLYDVGTGDYDTARSYVSVSQPIFRSGGIYSAIKYAYAMEKYKGLNVELQKQNMIKEALNLLFQIEKNKFNISKQELLVRNSEIEVERKREQVMSGILDSSDLDNAILELNAKRNTLLELEYAKDELINSFANFSDNSYSEFTLPQFTMISKDEFESKNINLQIAKSDINVKNYLKGVTAAAYLPSINFTYDYTKYHDDGGYSGYTDDTYYGINISIPLNINTFNAISSAKIDYLQSKIEYNNQVKIEQNYIRSKFSKIQMLDKKLQIAKNDLVLYDKLLTQVVELTSVGMKTKSDIETFQNSKKIKSIDIKIHNLEKQIELLDVYAKLYKASS